MAGTLLARESRPVLARLVVLTVTLLALGTSFTTADAATQVASIHGVSFEAEDGFGNWIRVEGNFIRVPESGLNSTHDRIWIECSATVLPARSNTVAAAVGIAGAHSTPSLSDGCHLRVNNVPELSAPGIGVPGEAAVTASPNYYRFNVETGGTLTVCVTGRALFTNGGLAEATDCGNAPSNPIEIG